MTKSNKENHKYRTEQPRGYSEYWGTPSNQPYYQPAHYPSQPPPGYTPTYYPPYPYYYQPPPKKNDSTLFFIIFIIIILVVVVPIIFAGIMWAMLSNIGPEERSYISITSQKKEYDDYFKITISSVSGGDLNVGDAYYNLIDDGGALEYKLRTSNSYPGVIFSGGSRIYPMTNYAGGVIDSSTGNNIDTNSDFLDYEYCIIAYSDTESDGLISPGDVIIIFKDNDNDGYDDIESKYIFRMMNEDDIVLEKSL